MDVGDRVKQGQLLATLEVPEMGDDLIRAEFAPLFAAGAAAERDPALRGPLHRLAEGMGVVPTLGDGSFHLAALSATIGDHDEVEPLP